MSIGKEIISHEAQKELQKKQLYSSNHRLNIVDANKKYIILLTQKVIYKYNSKQKMVVYMIYLLQNILLWTF